MKLGVIAVNAVQHGDQLVPIQENPMRGWSKNDNTSIKEGNVIWENTQHLFECEGYTEIRKNIRIEDTPMKTIRRNNINAIEVLSKTTEKKVKNNGRKD